MEKEKKVQRSFLLPTETIEKLKVMAKEEKRKFSAIVERLIENAYEEKTS